ncbi:MAG: T9SS type A sorting domain-containing protein [Candidatus Kapaibacterium sp.]
MKKLFSFFLVLFTVLVLAGFTNAQIAVTVDNPTNTTPNLSVSYTSLADAITALNSVTAMSGPVTLTLLAGGTETAPAGGYLLGSASLNAVTSATNTITFNKTLIGANPLITAFTPGTSTSVDGIWKIQGTDYVTINGIDLQENPANLTATEQMEWGYALVKMNAAAPFDGCQYVTIQNCVVALNKANTASVGIYAGNHIATATTSLTITATTDALNNCKFYNNTISNVYIGIRLAGFSAASPYTLYDQNNEIGNAPGTGNNITNYGGGTVTTYGIYGLYQNGLLVNYNTVNGGGTATTYGIFTSTGTNASVTIRGNTVTVQGGGTTSSVYAINNATGATGTTNTIDIYDNTVENCTYPTATSGAMYLLYTTGAAFNVNVYNNTVRNNTKSGTSGATYLFYNTNLGANGFENIYNNNIYGNTSSGSGTVYGLYSNSVSTATKEIYGNNIYDNTSGGSIQSLTQTLGITANVYKNQVYNNSSTSTGTTVGLVRGITASSGTNVYIYNNFVSDLKATTAASPDAVRGIDISSTSTLSTYGVYNNTVYLNASSSGANFGTTGIYHTRSAVATTGVLEMRNNIIVNNSTSAGTGFTVVFRRSASTDLVNFGSSSNNNDLYAGTPSASNLIFYDGTNSDQTMAAYKSRVTPRDASSFSVMPAFVNITTAPYDLHLGTAAATQLESGGAVVSTPNIVSDFDGNARYPNPGYPNNPSFPATAPDVGADEFAGIPQDLNGPSISYTPLGNTASTSGRVFSNVTITDPSGVNVDPGTKPRVYYKKSTDANTYAGNTNVDDGWKWVETSSGSSPFSFTLDYSILTGGGISTGEIVQYFVIAQDLINNVGLNSGTPAQPLTSVDLTVDEFPLSGTINQYSISGAITGEILVGTGQTYTSLTDDAPTGLFKAINEKVVTGNLTVKITSDLTETGAVALNQTNEEAIYTITIQPNDASLKTISGSYAGGLIRLNGADGITFDGRFSGSGNYLTISNTSTSTNSAAIQIISLGTNAGATDNTIRNCNILAGANTVTSTFGIFVGSAAVSTSGTGADNDNLTIQYNNISKAYYGIYARGVATTGELDGLNILNNSVGSSIEADYISGYGMYLSGMNGANINENEIYNMIYNGSKYGMYIVANVSNSVFSKNKIHTFGQLNTSAYYATGMYFSSATGTTNNQIDNNIVYDLIYYGSTSNFYNAGIRLAGGDGYKIYYNSVSHTGTFANTASGLYSICMYISTAATNVDMRNNIFYNSRSGTSPKSYTIYTPNTSTFTNLNYNDYYTTGAAFGYYGAEVANYSAWATASGEGVNSINVDPLFNSETNLQPGLTSPVLAAGTPIAGITTDILGVTRSGTVPSMGAYEQGADFSGPAFAYTPLLNTASTGNRVLSANISDPSGVPTAGVGLPVLYWKINAGSYNSVAGTFVSGNEYTFTFGAGVVMGDVVSYYLVAQDMLAPTPNVSASPSDGASGFTINPPAVSTPPTTPNSYIVSNTSLAGDYTVGTLMFNQVSGKNVYFEKVVKKVMKEVTLDATVTEEEITSKVQNNKDLKEKGIQDKKEVNVKGNNRTNTNGILSTETSGENLDKPISKKLIEVEEIEWVPMEDGKIYEGNLFVKRSDSPNLQYPDGIEGIYATITAALADLNLRGVSGATNFLLNDATYPTETFPLAVSVTNENMPSAVNTVTIKPNVGVTALIQGTAAASQIFLIKNSYVTIDGSNAPAGTTKDLTVENLSTSTPQVIRVGSTGTTPLTNTTIKNCNVINGANTSTAITVYGADGAAGYFNDITIQNNDIQKAYHGLYILAVMTGTNGSGTLVTNNTINSAVNPISGTGVYAQGVNGITVTDNNIANITHGTLTTSSTGVWFATGTFNGIISGNNISNLSYTGTGAYAPRGIAVTTGYIENYTITNNVISGVTSSGSSAPYGINAGGAGGLTIANNSISGLLNSNAGGYGARGLYLSTGVNSSNINVYNNLIYNVQATSDASNTYWVLGLAIDGATGGANIYYNTVNLYGTYAGYASATISSAFCVMNAGANAIEVGNNIFVNTYDNSAGLSDKSYSIYSAALNTAFTNINYNDYYAFGAPAVLGSILEIAVQTDKTTLAEWRTATGMDAYSVSGNPGFTSDINLIPDGTNANSWTVFNNGTHIAGITTDYAGNPRPLTVVLGTPDIGAYEFGQPSVNPNPVSFAPVIGQNIIAFNGLPILDVNFGNLGGITNLTVNNYQGVAPPGSGGDVPLYMNGYFVITQTDGVGYTYDITYTYSEAQLGTISTEDKVRLAKSDDNGVTWVPYLTAGTGAGQYELNTTNNTIKVFGLTAFSTFTITDSDSPLPVQLTSFTSSLNGRDVRLTWKTESEINNAGFDVERSVSGSTQWVKAGYVAGKGNSSAPISYTFEDKKLNSGKYNYRLKQIDNNGNFEYHALSNVVEVGLPTKYELSQNYPNPFNPTTKIDFSLPLDAKVSIKLYDITGREVKTLVNESRTAGYYTVQFNASDLSSGTYFYRIMTKSSSADYIMTKKMVLVK